MPIAKNLFTNFWREQYEYIAVIRATTPFQKNKKHLIEPSLIRCKISLYSTHQRLLELTHVIGAVANNKC